MTIGLPAVGSAETGGASAILTRTSAALITPTIFKGSGLFAQAPGITSPAEITVLAVFEHNCFFPVTIVAQNGPLAGSGNVLADPRFVQAGAGGTGMELHADGFAGAQAAYQLRPGSPLIAAGVPIAASGLRDYWGTPVGPHPNIGADQRANQP